MNESKYNRKLVIDVRYLPAFLDRTRRSVANRRSKDESPIPKPIPNF